MKIIIKLPLLFLLLILSNPSLSIASNSDSKKFVTKVEFDTAVKKLQDQIDTFSNNITAVKVELNTSAHQMQDQISELSRNIINSKNETEKTINNMENQLSSLAYAQSQLSVQLKALQDKILVLSDQASHSYRVGDKAFGGTIIHVTPDQRHGIVMADSNVQREIDSWHQINTIINDPDNYKGTSAQGYFDWRLPSTKELLDQCANNSGFIGIGRYWSSETAGISKQTQLMGDVDLLINVVDVSTDFKTKKIVCKVKTEMAGPPNQAKRGISVRPIRSF